MSAATNWEDVYRTQVEAIKELRAENADLRDTLDAVIEADGRAADLWRAAHPGKELVIPDRAKLVRWLLEQNATLREDKERLDWIARNRSVSATERPLFVTLESLRAAIDAARKEAQP